MIVDQQQVLKFIASNPGVSLRKIRDEFNPGREKAAGDRLAYCLRVLRDTNSVLYSQKGTDYGYEVTSQDFINNNNKKLESISKTAIELEKRGFYRRAMRAWDQAIAETGSVLRREYCIIRKAKLAKLINNAAVYHEGI